MDSLEITIATITTSDPSPITTSDPSPIVASISATSDPSPSATSASTTSVSDPSVNCVQIVDPAIITYGPCTTNQSRSQVNYSYNPALQSDYAITAPATQNLRTCTYDITPLPQASYSQSTQYPPCYYFPLVRYVTSMQQPYIAKSVCRVDCQIKWCKNAHPNTAGSTVAHPKWCLEGDMYVCQKIMCPFNHFKTRKNYLSYRAKVDNPPDNPYDTMPADPVESPSDILSETKQKPARKPKRKNRRKTRPANPPANLSVDPPANLSVDQ